MSKEPKKLNPLTMTDQELIEHCNKQVQALRMALDMIECEKHDRRHVRWAIVDALKEWRPAQQEPLHPEIKKMYEDLFDKCFRESSTQRKPLTNGEIYTAYITATNQTLRPQDERLAFAFARAIEAAHGIKENT